MNISSLSLPNTNFEMMCRICTADVTEMPKHYIFEDNHHISISVEENKVNKILLLLPISISKDDMLPKFICDQCDYKINMFCELRELSTKSDDYFRTYISKLPPDINDSNYILETDTIDTRELENIINNPNLEVFSSDLQSAINETEGVDEASIKRPIRSVRLNSSTFSNEDSLLDRLLKKREDGVERNMLKECEFCSTVISYEEYDSHINQMHSKLNESDKPARFSTNDEHTDFQEQPIQEKAIKKKRRRRNTFQCNFCLKAYNKKHLLELHIRRHTGERPFPCTICDKRYACKSSLTSHLLKHKEEWKHICTFCGKGFVDKHSYLYHTRSSHTGERPFECSKCKKRFIKKQDLVKHELTHSDMPAELFQCEECDKVCKDYDSLRSHRRSHIPVENRRVHKCDLCSASFTGRTGLLKHRNRHTGQKPFSCIQCKKHFYTKKGLDLHLVIHSGVKSFVCEICGRAFSQDNTLKVHLRTHTGERPYHCEVCFKRFTQSSALNSHKKLHNRDSNT